ncbi:MAG TPA: hypothetical protein VLA96_02215 [Terriglobales bacterium]|nr:hypothetical protein [Terriglobales bacterium]
MISIIVPVSVGAPVLVEAMAEGIAVLPTDVPYIKSKILKTSSNSRWTGKLEINPNPLTHHYFYRRRRPIAGTFHGWRRC